MKMTVFFLLCCFVLFSGCSSNRSSVYPGNDVDDVVSDVLSIFRGVYPAAKVRLYVNQNTNDYFGQAFLERLRASGYAVDEGRAAKGTVRQGELLQYSIAESGTEQLRVVIRVGSEVLCRLYAVSGQEGERIFTPLGLWVRGT